MLKQLALLLAVVAATQAADWGYEGAMGPANWGGTCSTGKKQSPIDIKTGSVTEKDVSEFILTGYGAADSVMVNNGHTINVEPAGTHTVKGGALGATFQLAGFHFHWGSDGTKGSEHTVDAKAYPLEVHFVHFNTKYAEVGDAVKQADGLAVLGFFFEVGDKNANYDNVVDAIENIRVGNGTINFGVANLDLKSLMGSDLKTFYRYSGSLTTPGCYESVTWTVFKKPIKISAAQLALFRAAFKGEDATSGQLQDNFRPVQPLEGRKVTMYRPSEDTTDGAAGHVSFSFSLLAASLVLFKLL